jgi:hypothetical protein
MSALIWNREHLTQTAVSQSVQLSRWVLIWSPFLSLNYVRKRVSESFSVTVQQDTLSSFSQSTTVLCLLLYFLNLLQNDSNFDFGNLHTNICSFVKNVRFPLVQHKHEININTTENRLQRLSASKFIKFMERQHNKSDGLWNLMRFTTKHSIASTWCYVGRTTDRFKNDQPEWLRKCFSLKLILASDKINPKSKFH